MKLADLKAMGAFVAPEPVAKEITWQDKTFTVHIRRLSYGQIERLLLAEPDDRSRGARFLAETICLGEGGKSPLPYQDAYALEPSLAIALRDAANEVNGGTSPKN